MCYTQIALSSSTGFGSVDTTSASNSLLSESAEMPSWGSSTSCQIPSYPGSPSMLPQKLESEVLVNYCLPIPYNLSNPENWHSKIWLPHNMIHSIFPMILNLVNVDFSSCFSICNLVFSHLQGLKILRETSFQQVLLSSSGLKENISISKFNIPLRCIRKYYTK